MEQELNVSVVKRYGVVWQIDKTTTFCWKGFDGGLARTSAGVVLLYWSKLAMHMPNFRKNIQIVLVYIDKYLENGSPSDGRLPD
jgi:hypothetical protein